MGEKMQEGLLNAYLESGFFPEWASPGHRNCMVGNNSCFGLADAYIKGIRGYDVGDSLGSTQTWRKQPHAPHLFGPRGL